jgi:Arc/MetJ-type ribon-helix-helix transcriptional regulator
MITGMTKKIAISLPDEQVERARRAVAAGRAPSVSAYIAQALARRAADDDLVEMLAEMDVQDGPPSAEDYAWAERVLGIGE